MCTHCHATAVYEPSNATKLYEEMKTIAAGLFDLTLNVPTGLALVDRNQLAEVIRGVIDSASESGAQTIEELDAQRTLGIYARKGMRRGIYIQTGLPRLLFLQVAAHEYAHAWQGENCPLLTAISNGMHQPEGQPLSPTAAIHTPPAPPSNANNHTNLQAAGRMAHEGFAEWLAYQVLGHYGYHRGQERMLGRTDIYGQGLRWALDIEKSCGVQGLLDACRLAQLDQECANNQPRTTW